MSSPINYDEVMIGAVGASSDTMNSMDTMIGALGMEDISSLSNTTLGSFTFTNNHIGTTPGGLTYPTLPTYGNITIGNAGAVGSGTYLNTNGTNWASITGSNKQSSLQVHGDAEFEGKVMINKRDLGEFMETLSKRLAILVPDPEKLEYFESLKKAYHHYKTLEALCEIPKEEEDK